jgi:hypothetical protein
LQQRGGLAIDIKPIVQGHAMMATEQLLLRVPDDLVRRFKQAVPALERSAFLRHLLEQALWNRHCLRPMATTTCFVCSHDRRTGNGAW